MKRTVFAIFALVLMCCPGARAYELYYGDLHSHTSFSDGMGVPDEAFDMARNDAKLDFWTLTDHYEQLDILEDQPAGSPKIKEWDVLRERAAAKTEPGKFIALVGYEVFDQPQGHINILNTKSQMKFGEARNLKMFYKWIYKHPEVLFGFNHPSESAEGGAKSFDNFAYVPQVASQAFYVAVNRNEDFEYYYKALDAGWRVGPSGQQDNHKKNWGLAESGDVTGVYAEKLTYDSLIDAFIGRRLIATNNRNMRINISAGDLPLGSQVKAASAELKISASVNENDNKIISLSLVSNGGAVIQEWKPDSAKAEYSFAATTAADGKTSWYLAVARDKNGRFAVTAPIWLTK